jgi:hypothetical protein
MTLHDRIIGMDRLEVIHAPSDRPERWHRVVGDTEAELDERTNELIASGRTKSTDGFVRHLIVSP